MRSAAAGRCDIAVPAGQWTWLQATETASRRVRYLHVAPFEGECSETIAFETDQPPGVHVFVIDASLTLPASGAEVEMIAPSSERPLWHGRTDADGHVFAPALADGSFLVRLPAARRAGDCSAGAMVNLQTATLRQEQVVVLVEPEPALPCRFHLQVAADAVAGQRPCLLACRLDKDRACVVPVAPEVMAGDSEVSALLPAGSYRLLVMPQGVASLGGDDAVCEVVEGGANEWHLRLLGNAVRTMELTGLGDDAMPVVVRQFSDDDLLEPAGLKAWMGPVRWHRRLETVSAAQQATRVLVSSRIGFWISQPVPPQGNVTVALQPACAIEVLLPIEPGRPELVAEADHAGGTVLRVMRRGLAQTPAGRVARQCAEFLVPCGPAAVRVRDAAGVVVFERAVMASGPRLQLQQ